MNQKNRLSSLGSAHFRGRAGAEPAPRRQCVADIAVVRDGLAAAESIADKAIGRAQATPIRAKVASVVGAAAAVGIAGREVDTFSDDGFADRGEVPAIGGEDRRTSLRAEGDACNRTIA